MDGDQVVLVQAPRDQPLRRRRPHLLGSTVLCLPALFICDPSVELCQGRRRVLDHDTAREAQQLQTSWPRQISDNRGEALS
ncbi:hypothetical protein ABT124_50775 [Streptomyces sp. NPDC001982]|uniref:hypothetical protein n=1 Tax=Streptomyces sp. NPDC001982 TaxID=3154405 RepID=UPI003323183B